ncbi:hypothetical protein LXL04_008852 [Taraxacum kok-saghyz]
MKLNRDMRLSGSSVLFINSQISQFEVYVSQNVSWHKAFLFRYHLDFVYLVKPLHMVCRMSKDKSEMFLKAVVRFKKKLGIGIFLVLQRCSIHMGCIVSIESRSFENSYIPENPRTPKPLTFSKNRLRGAKIRSNISPVAKKKFRKNDFFFSKNFAYVQTFFLEWIKYNTKRVCHSITYFQPGTVQMKTQDLSEEVTYLSALNGRAAHIEDGETIHQPDLHLPLYTDEICVDRWTPFQ